MSVEDSSNLVTREEFNLVGRRQHKVAPVIGRAWASTVYAALIDQKVDFWEVNRPFLDYPSVNFDNVRQTVRHLESGQSHTMLLGKSAWNIIAEINNQGLRIDNPDYIIPWTEWIHRDFNNGEGRRLRSAERLQIAYQELGRLAINPQD